MNEASCNNNVSVVYVGLGDLYVVAWGFGNPGATVVSIARSTLGEQLYSTGSVRRQRAGILSQRGQ